MRHIRKYLGGRFNDALDLSHPRAEILADQLDLLILQAAHPHQRIHIQPVCFIRGKPPGGGMGLLQIALFL